METKRPLVDEQIKTRLFSLEKEGSSVIPAARIFHWFSEIIQEQEEK